MNFSNGYRGAEALPTSATEAQAQPRTVQQCIEVIHARLNQQQRLIEQVAEITSPIRNDVPAADQAKANSSNVPVPASSLIVADLRSIIDRIDANCQHLCYVRDTMEL